MTDYIEKIRRINLIRKYNKEQEQINKEIQENGITDEIILKQVALNHERTKNNIPDTTKNIHKNYVQ